MSNDLDTHIRQARSYWAANDMRPAFRELLNAVECLAHPAPPPSPGEENGGEASDEELDQLWEAACREAEESHVLESDRRRHERRALFNAGREHERKHQASADAATIAGLRRVVAYFDKYGETIVESCDPADDSSMAEDTEALIASLRPEPGGGK